MSKIGRHLCMMTSFGTEEPLESIVHSHTFTQILMADVEFINFHRSGMRDTFEASKNWIGDAKDLSRMLSGGLIAYPKAGIEASRLETAYRYLFKEIWYGPSGNLVQFSKEGNTPTVDWNSASSGPFSLVLVSFEKCYWDELPSLVIKPASPAT